MGNLLHNKTLMLPVALIGGAVLHEWMGYLTFLSPYLIFAMLFIPTASSGRRTSGLPAKSAFCC